MLEGTKYDNGKLRLAEMVVDFKIPMEELCKVWEFGANKYEKSNWKKLANPIDRYTNAMLRHLLDEEDSLTDSESGLLHASHIAFNALARLYFLKKSLKPVNYEPGSIVEMSSDHEDFRPIITNEEWERLIPGISGSFKGEVKPKEETVPIYQPMKDICRCEFKME